MSLVGICLRCPHVQKPPYSGACACLFEPDKPVDILERISGKCPAGFFDNPPAPIPPPPPPPLSPDAQQLIAAESAGLGDDVERLAKALGADKLAKVFEEITGWDCGCEARKTLLNKLPGIGKMWGWVIR